MSSSASEQIINLFREFHSLGFIHKSAYNRNILTHLGVVSLRLSERSYKTLCSRIIDLGRTKTYDLYEKGERFQVFKLIDEKRCGKVRSRFQKDWLNEKSRAKELESNER